MPTTYVINENIAHGALEVIDLGQRASECPHDWFNQSLALVNDSVVRMGIFKGEFHWHKHDVEDEFFFVLEGSLAIEFRDRTVELGPLQGIVVPHGIEHRPRSAVRTVVLMVEPSTVKPKGDG
jgi:mannose-6-phosphate isomerase-like protein (cupin superfamily)